MGLNDWVNFVVFDNPVSKSVISLTGGRKALPAVPNVTVITEKVPLWRLASETGPFIRIAGLMGFAAAAMGAYGAHANFSKDSKVDLREMFETANRYHFFHTLALLGVPMCRHPKITATLLISGTLVFSGSLYYRAIANDDRFGRITPFGGTILLLGWLSMVV